MKRKLILFTFIGMLAFTSAPVFAAEAETAPQAGGQVALSPGNPRNRNRLQRPYQNGVNQNRPYRNMPYQNRQNSGAELQNPQFNAAPNQAPGMLNENNSAPYFNVTPNANNAQQFNATPNMNNAQQFNAPYMNNTPQLNAAPNANNAQEFGAQQRHNTLPRHRNGSRRFNHPSDFDHHGEINNIIGHDGYNENYNTGRTRDLIKGTAIPGVIDIFHVKPGDTIYEISQKYGLRMEAVIDANPELHDPALIYPGDEIRVPLNEKIDDNMSIGGSKYYGGVRNHTHSIQKPAPAAPSVPALLTHEKEILDLVNKERAKAGVPALKLSVELGKVAHAKSADMSANNYFSHTSAKYGSPFDMMKTFGVTYKTAGENIAKGQKTAVSVMAAWMASAGHKQNILNAKFTEIGVGYVVAGNGTTYWTQMFIGR